MCGVESSRAADGGGSESARVWVSVEGVTGLEKLEELRLDGRRLAPGADGGYAVTLGHRDISRR